MPTYEQRLAGFVKGRQFTRLSRPIRDRADAVCDACGSTQARTLFVLKDEESGRYSFVGDTCLREMTRLGAILRRFGKEAAREAYERELAQRVEEATAAATTPTQESSHEAPDEGPQRPEDAHSIADPATGHSPQPDRNATPPAVLPTLFILEAPTYYHALALFLAPDGRPRSWGYARENRYRQVRRHIEGQADAEEIRTERSDALPASVAVAWAHACSRLDALPELSGIPQLLTRLESRNDIGELVAALFAVAGRGDDHEQDCTDGVNGSTNGQMPLGIKAERVVSGDDS